MFFKKKHFFTVELGQINGPQSIFLKYKLRNTVPAELWFNLLQKAKSFGFSETDRFYNFPKNNQTTLEDLIEKLKDNIDQYNKINSEKKIPYPDLNRLSKSLNELHQNFAHAHLVENSVNNENVIILRDFNRLIHEIEDYLHANNKPHQFEIPPARIVITFNQPNKIEIPEPCYEAFTLIYEFGTVYINYAQVGKQLIEMYLTADDQLQDEHIQPARYFSADLSMWFGPDLHKNKEKKVHETLALWFNQRSERFNRLGFFWEDPKLSLGHVPVADLIENIQPNQRALFQKKLGEFNCIKKIIFED